MRTRQLRQLYTQGSPFLAVYNDHIEMLKNGVYTETHIGLDKDEIMLN